MTDTFPTPNALATRALEYVTRTGEADPDLPSSDATKFAVSTYDGSDASEESIWIAYVDLFESREASVVMLQRRRWYTEAAAESLREQDRLGMDEDESIPEWFLASAERWALLGGLPHADAEALAAFYDLPSPEWVGFGDAAAAQLGRGKALYDRLLARFGEWAMLRDERSVEQDRCAREIKRAVDALAAMGVSA